MPAALPAKLLVPLGGLLVALVLEALAPLRRATQGKARRAAVNLGLAAVGALALRAFFFPIVLRVAAWTQAERRGLLPALGLRGAAAAAAGLVLLDYTLYVWHRANHHWPFLWRFHGVHHADLDLDVTTASRFHVGELVLSTGWRSAQVAVLGIDPATLALFETLVTLAAQFHHANVRLPFGAERMLSRWIVTPRMHGIHHSLVQRETDSNFSTVLNIWDRLHATLRLNVPQDAIAIGVPGYRDPAELGFWRSLLFLPLAPRPWRLPDGRTPERPEPQSPRGVLAA